MHSILYSILNSPLLYCILAGLFFGAWPVLAKRSGINYIWMTIIIPFFTSAVAIIFQVFIQSPLPSFHASVVTPVVFAGVLNGFGFLAYGKAISLQTTNTWIVVFLVSIGMPIGTFITESLTSSMSLTQNQIIGIFLGLSALFFLTRP